jgi:methionyl-tRNA formyltransferase
MTKKITNNSLKIVFFGAPYFSKEILKDLLKNNISVDTVITHPDQPVGRKKEFAPTPTKIFALENNIPIKEFHKLDDVAVESIRAEKPDLFIVASYGAILPAELLILPRLGALNVHPSLLPKLRGASPIQTALLSGLLETGTTIMLMDAGMDTGNIIKQEKLSIQQTTIYPNLEQQLLNLSSKLLASAIKDIFNTHVLPNSTEQIHHEATYTKIIQKQDGLIDWQESAEKIYNKWKAFYNWPKIYAFYNNQKLIFTEIELYPKNDILKNRRLNVGEVCLNEEKDLLINTKDGFLKINYLQLAGKNELSVKDFLNGQLNFIGTILK